MKWAYDENCDKCLKDKKPCCAEHTPKFNHYNLHLDTNPSRQLMPMPHHNPSSTASASYFRD